MATDTFIIKYSGERELFDNTKLQNSLLRAGALSKTADSIVNHIQDELQDGMTTAAIYKHAFSLLKKLERPVAARYSLRKAMTSFGPTGFPFEKYLAALFQARGFETLTDQIVQGQCVPHEIDVVAYNPTKLIMVEAKFHNQIGEKSDLKVILYVKARFDDLIEQIFSYGGPSRPLDEGWLITNTKFTDRAITYGKCAGVKMIGWNYPEKGNLQDLIEDVGLHPITCLTTLSTPEKQLLFEEGIVLCNRMDDTQRLKSLGFKDEEIVKIQAEATAVCQV